MIKNNLKIAYRVLSKNPTFTFINILGLSTGLAIALLIISYARYEFSYEKSIPLSDRMVRITMDYLNGAVVIDQDAETYAPLGPKIKSGFSEVVEFARAESMGNRSVKVGDNYFNVEKVYAVDPSFFNLFGNPPQRSSVDEPFAAPYEMVLTYDLANRIFGHSDVIGQSLEITGSKKPYQIVGLIADVPANTHFKYNMLVSFATLVTEEKQDKESNWNSNNMYTYLLLQEASQLPLLQQHLDDLSAELMAGDIIEGERVIAQPMRDIHLHSHKSYEPEVNGNASSIFILLGVAFLVIFIAIVNYINLATAKSLDRAKEVGIRKVIGSSIAQLRMQFVAEAFLINLMAVFLALLLMMASLQPFRAVADLPDQFGFIDDPIFWMMILGLLVVSTSLSAVFPALILSSFRPISVLKGKFSHSIFGINLRKGLVVFQFAITTFLLIQTFTVHKQLQYLRTMDLGVDIDHTLVVNSPDTKEYQTNFTRYKDQLLDQPEVLSVAFSSCVPGLPTSELGSTTGINLKGAVQEHNFNFYIYFIDQAFVPTLNIELLAGENFKEESENKNQILVNEESIRLWEIPSAQEAIGKSVVFWGSEKTIVGVVKNFHQLSAKSEHIPLIFNYAKNWHEMASIKLSKGDVASQLAMVKDTYKASFPHSPFNYYFLDEEFNKQYAADQRFQAVFRLLSSFAMLIACLGLFGLISFTISRRGKEIGIRKVLGASVSQIIGLLTKDLIRLILISILLAAPVTYYIVNKWLMGYAYRIDLTMWLFILPAVAVVSISILTLFGKTYQFSLHHPATSMRDD